MSVSHVKPNGALLLNLRTVLLLAVFPRNGKEKH